MTTRVTVDTHAGWPVLVANVDMDEEGKWRDNTFTIVPPNTTIDFYIYGSRQLLISEMGKDDTTGITRKTED